jgi:hypothetical protein
MISCLLLSAKSSVRTHRTVCAVSSCVLLLGTFMLYFLPSSDKPSKMLSVYMWQFSEHLFSQKMGSIILIELTAHHTPSLICSGTSWFNMGFSADRNIILRVSLSTTMKPGLIVNYSMRDFSFSSVQSTQVLFHKIHLPQELHFAALSYKTRSPRADCCCYHHSGPGLLFPINIINEWNPYSH